jgi:hypothetical protein
VSVTYQGTGGTTYGPSTNAPTDAGSYTVTASLTNTDYTAEPVTGTLTIAKAPATLTLTDPSPSFVYDGTARSVTATTNPASLVGTSVSYEGTSGTTYGPSTSAPTDAGTYTVTATLANPNYTAAPVSGTLAITQAIATLTLGNLNQTFDGSAKAVTVTTAPVSNLTGVTVTYDGLATAPSAVGRYAVEATLTNRNYSATPARGTLVIAQLSGAMTLTASAVAPNPIPQFSDPLTLVAEVPAGASGSVTFSIKTSSSATASTWTGSAAVNTTTNKAFVTVPSLDQSVAPSGAATYYASASFVAGPSSSYSTIAPATTEVILGKEGQGAGGSANGSSRIDYGGTQFVSAGTAPRLTATLFQSLAPEATDGTFIDFSKVTVNATFQLFPAGCNPTCATAPAWPPTSSTAGTVRVANVTGATDGSGTVSVTAPKTLPEGAYLVVVTVNSNSFIAPLSATSTLTVGTTNGTYMNGGGLISPDSTATLPNRSGAFGFNAKTGSSGPTGSAIYVYRMRIDTATSTATTLVTCTTLGGDCHDVDVTIRAVIGNFVPGQSTTYPKTAFVTGPALVQFVDAESRASVNLGFSGGNFRLDATDFATNGNNDTFGFTLYGPDGAPYHQAYIPSSNPVSQSGLTSATNQVKIATGNLTVKPK